jgi:hypothetical protein
LPAICHCRACPPPEQMLPVQGQYQGHVQSCGVESLLKEPVWRSWFSQEHHPLHLNCQIELTTWITKQNCRIKLPNWIAKGNCKTELPNRIAKQSCQTQLPNQVTKQNYKTELLNRLAKLN